MSTRKRAWTADLGTVHVFCPYEQAVDPDIDTLPLLAWSSEMASTVGSAAHRAILRMQHYFFIPILLVARFSWAEQSISHNFIPKARQVLYFADTRQQHLVGHSIQQHPANNFTCCHTVLASQLRRPPRLQY